MKKLVAAYNAFGFKLFKEVVDKHYDRNALISSLSLSFSLAMLYHGAKGETRQAIARVLEIDETKGEKIGHQNAMLRATLDETDARVEISLANAIWVNKGLTLDPAFLKLIRQTYRAQATSVDFNDAAAIRIINEWVQKSTGGKLDRILDEDDLKGLTDCVLTNGVYFKGLWATPFEKKATRKGPFYLSERKQKSVPFMSQTLETAYLQGEGFQSTGLSYGDGKVSMYIFLPSEDSSLKEFLGNLNADNWDRWMSEFRKTQVELMLPRFKAAYDCSLRGPLGNLSGKIIFTSGADFSPMGLGNHFVSRFKHRALVEVNEEGTEAAATTAVLVGRSLFGPPRFIVNRPFFLAIRDNKSQTILFTGIIVDPD